MGVPVEGVVADGDEAEAVAPIIVAGVDSDGNVIPIQVDADGVVQIAVTP